MASGRVLAAMVLIGAMASTPAWAQRRDRDGNRDGNRGEARSGERNRDGNRERGQAVARSRDGDRGRDVQQQRNEQRQIETQRRVEAQRQVQAQRQNQAQRQVETQRRYDAQRRWESQRRNDGRRYDGGRYDGGRWDGRRDSRVYVRPQYRGGRFYNRTVIVPRYIRPSIVTVIPYRPYVYRPRLSIGVYYGAGSVYPYGYTPRGYYDPLPGHYYGGVRITGAPRDAQVFADGYYVGIVDDFDGVFQHMNLEAGPHHIEIEIPGYDDALTFDIVVQPGRTITYRADVY
jgi:hypothetical protein